MILPMAQSAHTMSIVLPVRVPEVGWEILDDGEKVPQSEGHGIAIMVLIDVLRAWAEKRGAKVLYDMATRWDQKNPRVGVDPDVSILLPPPPPAPPPDEDLRSVRTWLPGHVAPLVAIEVVSKNHPIKDYAIAPEKYAASGTKELWIFDAKLVGPRSYGGPFRLQVYSRTPDHGFKRIYEGEGPAFSPAIGAWLVVVKETGRRPTLRIAEDEAGMHLWPTVVEKNEAMQAKIEEMEAKAAAAEAELETFRAKERARDGG